MRTNLFPWAALLALLCHLPVNAIAANDTEGDPGIQQNTPETKATRIIHLLPAADYHKDGVFSDAAHAECNLAQEITNEFIKRASRYQLSTAIVNSKDELASKENAVTIRIDKILAGRPGSGFGGRWVISELDVTTFISSPGSAPSSQFHTCSAGLGANPFANFGACQRLSRCSEQLGKKIAAWLRLETSKRSALTAMEQNTKVLPETAK